MRPDSSRIMVIGIIAVILFSGAFSMLSFTGFVTLDQIEIMPEKDVYEIGDMAHLFVVPSDAGYEIEVYDPENNLVANGLNFFVEKEGYYTVNSVLTSGNTTVERSASFKVITPDIEQVIEEGAGNQDTDSSTETNETVEEPITEPINFTVTFINETANLSIISPAANVSTPKNATNISAAGDIISNETIVIPEENLTLPTNETVEINQTTEINETINKTKPIPPKAKGKGQVKNVTAHFKPSDMIERTETNEKEEQIKVVEMGKNGIKIIIKGADKNNIKNARFEDEIIHIDTIPIQEATIEIPHEGLPGIMMGPQLLIREDIQAEFTQAEAYTKNNRTYNQISVKKNSYEFTVEHFTNYYINNSGADYNELQTCLIEINNSANTCIINQFINETFNTSYLLKYTATNVINLVDESVNNTYIDFNKSVIYGDDGDEDVLLSFTGGGTSDSTYNSTIYNLTSVDYGIPLTQNSLSVKGQRFVGKNLNFSSMQNSVSVAFVVRSANSTLENIIVKDGIFGVQLVDFGDSIIANFQAVNFSDQYNIFVNSENCNNIRFSKINASSNQYNLDTGFGFYFDANGCTGGNISNSTFAFNNGTGLHWEAFNSTIINNTFMNNTKAGLEFDTTSFNGTIGVLNNTFENNNNQRPTTSFLASYSRANVSVVNSTGNVNGSRLMPGNGNIMIAVNTALGGTLTWTADDKDASSLFDGSNNFSRWFIISPTQGIVGNTTLYVEMGYATSCASLAAAGGGTCWGYQDDYWVAANATQSYNISIFHSGNTTVTIMQGDTASPTVRSRKQILKTLGDINTANGYLLNISNNAFIDNYPYISEDIVRIITYDTNNWVTSWLNRFYYSGEVNLTDTSKSAFCYNSFGNFYAEGFNNHTLGNAECGPSNLTGPNSSDSYLRNNTLQINWTNQSSLTNISYHLLYSNNSGTTWNNITFTGSTNYTWNISTLSGSNFLVKVTPYEMATGTNGTSNQSQAAFTIGPDNQQVCSSTGLCEYQDITTALEEVNGNGLNITLSDANTIYNITNVSIFNLLTEKGIIINGTNITLDCNNGGIKGGIIADSKGIFIYDNNNATIKNCLVTNYSYGIYIDNSSNSKIHTSNISNNTHGIFAANLTNLNITNTTSAFNTIEGIYLYNVNDTRLRNNTLMNNSGTAGFTSILMNRSWNNSIVGNIFKDQSSTALALVNASLNNVSDNTFNQTRGIIIMHSGNNNITRNTFYNTLTGHYDLNISSTASNDNTIWKNNFYSKGVYDTGTNNSFCRNLVGTNEGNFYHQDLNKSYIENVTFDCGPLNITNALSGTNKTTSLGINWKKQSSIETPTYLLRYSNNSGTDWYDIGTTQAVSYSWSFVGLHELSTYQLMVKAYDSRYNATIDTTPTFGIDSSAPAITAIVQKNESGTIITPSQPARIGDNVIVTINLTDAVAGVHTVWSNTWQTTRAGGTSLIIGAVEKIAGTGRDGQWQINITTNANLANFGEINYTIYANDTASNLLTYDGNFSLVDNNQVCSNTSACEYQKLETALRVENNTANIIFLLDANTEYTLTATFGYNISPTGMNPAIRMNNSNQTINCLGSSLTGSNAGTGILSNTQNRSIIRNCIIKNYDVGINFTNSSDNSIEDTTIMSNDVNNLLLQSVNNSVFTRLNMRDSGADSLLIMNSSNNIFKDINITNSSQRGINAVGSYANLFEKINSSRNILEGILINESSDDNIISNSSFENSTNSQNMKIDAAGTNITGNNFRTAPSGQVDLYITTLASTTSVWANNFFSRGVNDSGTGTLFCINNTGNYYNGSINSTFALIGSCGNLSQPYQDSDKDGYYSLYDCNDNSVIFHPKAAEVCDEQDNDCDGLIDDGLSCPTPSFGTGGTSSGSGSGGGGAGYTQAAVNIDESIAENVVELKKGDIADFTVKGVAHSLTIDKVYENKVEMTIRSNPITFVLLVGEKKEIDFENDNKTDVKIKLEGINGAKTVITIETLAEKVNVVEEPAEITEEPVVEEGTQIAIETPSILEKISKISSTTGTTVKKILTGGIYLAGFIIILTLLIGGIKLYNTYIKKLTEIEKYIKTALKQGITIDVIRKELINAGWEEQVIQELLKNEKEMKNKKTEIDGYITKSQKSGISEEQIKSNLESKGWNPSLIANKLNKGEVEAEQEREKERIERERKQKY